MGVAWSNFCRKEPIPKHARANGFIMESMQSKAHWMLSSWNFDQFHLSRGVRRSRMNSGVALAKSTVLTDHDPSPPCSHQRNSQRVQHGLWQTSQLPRLCSEVKQTPHVFGVFCSKNTVEATRSPGGLSSSKACRMRLKKMEGK